MSMRRISDVPAPISYSLASRHSRPGGVLVDVAVAAERLDRFAGHPRRLLGRVQDGAGRILARGFAAVARLGHGVDVGPARIHGGVHVGDLALHQLELADGLAELLALVDVGHHDVHAGLHDAQRAAREHGALVVQAAHQDLHAAIDFTQDVLRPALRSRGTRVRRCWSRACRACRASARWKSP